MPDQEIKLIQTNTNDEKIEKIQKSYDVLYAKYVELNDKAEEIELGIMDKHIRANTITASKYNELRNTYVFNGDDSLDATFPFELDFEIVSEMTAINSVKLSFRISQFRAYSTGVPSGGGSTTVSGGGSTTVSGGGSTSGSSVGISYLPCGVISDYVRDSGTGYGLIVDTDVEALSFHTHSTPNHAHATPNHAHATPNHAHGITYGIYEDSQSPTIHYHIDNGAGFGGASGDFTTDQLDINITASITTVGFKRIAFHSNARCRIRAWVMCKVDLTA